MGPQAASCRWLYRNATTLSRRWARRPPLVRGCTAMPPLFLVGGPAGRLMHVAVPQCHHSFSKVGLQAASWLYRDATPLSRRWARRPPHARGCTAMPPLVLVGGLPGRLLHVATALSRRWARRPLHACGCTTMPPLFLGGPAGRLLHMTVPRARQLMKSGPAVCPKTWLSLRSISLAAYRWARRSPPVCGCTAMPPLFVVGGPAGRLMHVAVP